MKIAIAGYGIEGEANYRYWSADPENDLTIVDEALTPAVPLPDGAKTLLGPGSFGQLEDFDLVVRTASLNPKKIRTNGKVWSATNEFFARCPAPIIGVTGTKGKGTTASLIASILEAAGKKVWLVGNIGTVALSSLDDISADDIVVFELSSFQLWDSEKSPHIAVVLFIEQEHLDIHDDLNDYIDAKARIARFQQADDTIVYMAANPYASQIAQSSSAKKIAYPDDHAAHFHDDAFWYGEQRLFASDALQLRGRHNQENTLAAISAVWSFVSDAVTIEAGVRAFKGLPHRLAFVGSVNGVDYYDDSIATTPNAALAALRAFPNRHKVIILGGSSKGSDFSELAKEIAAMDDVYAILTGEEGEVIAKAFQDAGVTHYDGHRDASMPQLVERAAEAVQAGGVVLLSPAAASFDRYKNYADRGDQFAAAVAQLA